MALNWRTAIIMVERLANLLPIQQGDLVGAYDQCIGEARGYNLCFDLGQPPGGLLGVFSGKRGFVDIGSCGLKRDLQGGQQLAPIYRGRGQDKRLRIQDIPLRLL